MRDCVRAEEVERKRERGKGGGRELSAEVVITATWQHTEKSMRDNNYDRITIAT